MAYREYTSESYSFLTIDTTLPANDSLILSCKNIAYMTLLVYKLLAEWFQLLITLARFLFTALFVVM